VEKNDPKFLCLNPAKSRVSTEHWILLQQKFEKRILKLQGLKFSTCQIVFPKKNHGLKSLVLFSKATTFLGDQNLQVVHFTTYKRAPRTSPELHVETSGIS